MKKLITLSILLISMKVIGQLGVSTFSASKQFTLNFYPVYDASVSLEKICYVTIVNDTITYVNGNPLEMLNHLYKENQKKDSIISSKNKLINASINFINNTGDFPRENNCYWPALLKQLKRCGYQYSHSKKSTKVCTNK